MRIKGTIVCFMSLFLFMPLTASFTCAEQNDGSRPMSQQASGVSSQQPASLLGTWSGNFQSSSSDRTVPAFSITVQISPDSAGHLVGSASLNSECLQQVKLQVQIQGAAVVLAGSDSVGTTLTIRGAIDQTGTLLKVNYIMNSTGSGTCEVQNGTGTLGKQ
jgi:hypothetical protein